VFNESGGYRAAVLDLARTVEALLRDQ
jgi:hypothetical protein